MNWFLIALKKYAVFNGRASRSEYWYFTLFYIIILIALVLLDTVIGTAGILSGIAMLGFFIPSLAVTIRRLHDIDKSGWWILISIVPIVGLILFIFLVKKGTDGDNRFGPDSLTAM